MATEPVKDVFEDDDQVIDDDQRVVSEAEEAAEKEGTETAVKDAVSDDIEVVLAEEEAAEKPDEEEKPDEADDKDLAAVEGADTEVGADEEIKTYSKKVQDRIERERRLVRRTREEAEVAVGSERTKRIEAERKSLTAHKNLTAVLLVNIDGQLKAKSTELKAMLEAGDTDKQVDVQGELDDLRAKKRELEAAKVFLEQEANEFERKVKEVQAPAEPKVTPSTQSWLGQNKWFGKKGFAAETLLVRTMDQALAAERSDKGSAEYFRELNRRIRSEMPDLTDKVKRSFTPASKINSAVAPVSRSAGVIKTDAAGKRRVTLDRSDLQNMRDHRLDPTNKDHVAMYAREKLAAQ